MVMRSEVLVQDADHVNVARTLSEIVKLSVRDKDEQHDGVLDDSLASRSMKISRILLADSTRWIVASENKDRD